jgi:tripartite-type tricarboxylate transporter receptor subunit TctC
MLAPAKTPPEIIGALNAAMRKALDDTEVRRRITSEGGVPSPTSPEGLTAFIREETAKYEKIAKAAKLEMDR